MNKNYLIVGMITFSLSLSACAPAIVGGAAAVGGSIVQEKGVSGNIKDSQISTQIKVGLYQKDPNLYHHVNVKVENGEVMLTGNVENDEMQLEAVKIAWEVKGVKRVIDKITVAKQVSVKTYAQDAWITTQAYALLLADKDVQSLNYSVKTIEGQAYLMGIAQDKAELDKAIEVLRHINGVKKVISYVKLVEQV